MVMMMMSCGRKRLSLGRMAVARSISRKAQQQQPCSLTVIRQFASRPVRRSNVSPAERAKLRAARKERASKIMEQQQQGGGAAATKDGAAATAEGAATAGGAGSTRATTNVALSRYIWYLSVGVPSALLAWGFSDENSPPARLCKAIGLTGLVRSYTDEIAKPAHTKLLPDWSQVCVCVCVCVLLLPHPQFGSFVLF